MAFVKKGSVRTTKEGKMLAQEVMLAAVLPTTADSPARLHVSVEGLLNVSEKTAEEGGWTIMLLDKGEENEQTQTPFA